MVEETTAASHSLSKEVIELSRLVNQFNIHSPGSEPQMMNQTLRAHQPPAARPLTKSAPKRTKTVKVVNGGPARDEPDDWKEF
jgi:methyl-accepting chemotaxis protein